jgi:hypothetical protein
MKTKIKTWFYSLLVLGLLTTIAAGCTKKDDVVDLASAIAGTYTGTINVGGSLSASASSNLSRSTNTIVNLIITIGTTTIPLNGINVSNPSSNNYNLSLTDAGGSFIGTVQGNRLSWTLTAGSDVDVFTGTK